MSGYFSRQRGSAQQAAQFTSSQPFDRLDELLLQSDALFLTVPDGAISHVFADLQAYDLQNKQICHCSGALTAGEAFPGIQQRGAYGYSIHPLFPISQKLASYRELPDAFFCLEGSGPHLEDWKNRLELLCAGVRILPPEQKARYHAACTVASNFMCALAQVSVDLLRDCGFSQSDALSALAPLMQGNLAHLLEAGPEAALTGPVERGDTDTVEKHLLCLGARAERQLYCGASAILAKMAARKHPERDQSHLKRILEQGGM